MLRSGLCYDAQPWPFALTFLSQAQSQPHDAKITHAPTSATDAALTRPCQSCRRKPQAVAAPQHPRGSCQNLQPPHPGSLIQVPYHLRIDMSTKNVPSKESRRYPAHRSCPSRPQHGTPCQKLSSLFTSTRESFLCVSTNYRPTRFTLSQS